MSHGRSLITRKSTIEQDIVDVLVTHPFFQTKRFTEQDHFIPDGQPTNVYDEAVLRFLDAEGMEYRGKQVEYWFQSQGVGERLAVHCDYNHQARSAVGFDPSLWKEDRIEKFISPITIAAYLEVSDDMEGGELNISSATWEDLGQYTVIDFDRVLEYDYETITPKQQDVLYFHGSMHYHWIGEVTQGSRKSLLINFWPLDL